MTPKHGRTYGKMGTGYCSVTFKPVFCFAVENCVPYTSSPVKRHRSRTFPSACVAVRSLCLSLAVSVSFFFFVFAAYLVRRPHYRRGPQGCGRQRREAAARISAPIRHELPNHPRKGDALLQAPHQVASAISHYCCSYKIIRYSLWVL